jgi:acetyltransferase-like isoleucine patch superfamily enzyme
MLLLDSAASEVVSPESSGTSRRGVLRDESAYRASRKTPQWLLHARKPLGLLSQVWFGWKWRVRFLRWMGVHIEGSYVGRDCLFDQEVPELITVEPGVTMSSRIIVIAHDSQRQIVGEVRICRGAFIGAGAIILPGVCIGEKAVVAAGAVVTRSVPAGETVAGVPAVPMRRRRTEGTS